MDSYFPRRYLTHSCWKDRIILQQAPRLCWRIFFLFGHPLAYIVYYLRNDSIVFKYSVAAIRGLVFSLMMLMILVYVRATVCFVSVFYYYLSSVSQFLHALKYAEWALIFFFFVALLLLAPLSFEPELQFFGGVVIFSSSLSSTFFSSSFICRSFFSARSLFSLILNSIPVWLLLVLAIRLTWRT